MLSCLFPPAAGGALFGATKTIDSILVGMVTTGAKAALIGMIIGGIMGGLSAALYGGDVWDGIASSAMSGAINGFIVAVAIYAISTIVSTAVQAIRVANAARRATSLSNVQKFKFANRGQSSTGRRNQYNLKEQLAMEQAISNPLAEEILPIKMTDARWLATEGWVKMQQTFIFTNGNKTIIHYLLNNALSLIDDFKFVFPV